MLDHKTILPWLNPVERQKESAKNLELRYPAGDMLFLPSLLDFLPNPIILVDERRNITAVNRSAAEAFSIESVNHDLALSIRHPDVLEAVDDVLDRHIQRQIEQRQIEQRQIEQRQIEVTFQFPVMRMYHIDVKYTDQDIMSHDQEPGVYVLLIFRDITDAHRIEKVRSDLITNVSHELRSPLTAISGFIETLGNAARDDPKARGKFLSIMQREANRMSRIIDNLLFLAQAEVSEHISPTELISLMSILFHVRDTLSTRARNRQMTILIEEKEPVPDIPGDEDQLIQVFINLVDNAIKYGRPGAQIRLTVSLEQEYVMCAVADQGEGIPREFLSRLTERFFRVDKARSRELGSAGLGLAITKHILNRHQGYLRIESEPRHGSVFSVRLPLKS